MDAAKLYEFLGFEAMEAGRGWSGGPGRRGSNATALGWTFFSPERGCTARCDKRGELAPSRRDVGALGSGSAQQAYKAEPVQRIRTEIAVPAPRVAKAPKIHMKE